MWGGTLSTLWGFRAVMDTAVVITQRLLLPTPPHLRRAKMPVRRRKASRQHLKSAAWSAAWSWIRTSRDVNTSAAGEKWF